MAVMIDGKAVSARLRQKMAAEVAAMKEAGVVPGLAVVLVGENPASQVYVRNKIKACEELGIRSQDYRLPEDTTQEALLDLVGELNRREDIHGILVQLPLPGQIREEAVIAAIAPEKDVDAFHARNVGKIVQGSYNFLPCTPAGVMELIRSIGVSVQGKECVVVGRSNIVGKPMALLMLHENATVTICHTKTTDMPALCRQADILIVAAGKAGVVDSRFVSGGQTVIDVGIHAGGGGKLCGDVAFSEVEPLVEAITPVPGGVGGVTSTVLVKHVVEAAERGASGIRG